MKVPRPLALALVLMIAATATIAGCNDSNNSGGVLNPPPKELDSGNIPNGGTFGPHTFANVGTFNYHCTIHSSMTGSVIVVSGAPATATVTISNFNFTPQSTSVMPGGTVTWNNTGVTHTVTSN
jgi:plastocyanin